MIDQFTDYDVLWEQVRDSIPTSFKYKDQLNHKEPGNHNGASSPFRIFYPIIYELEERSVIRDNSYVHDFGYIFGHLPGAPYAHLTRNQWDKLYRDYYIRHDMIFTSRTHYFFTDNFGQKSWDRNDHRMHEWGYYQYSDYI